MQLLQARRILEKTSPIPFIGFFVVESADRVIDLRLNRYVYVLIDLEREHYSLAGRVDGQSFRFDSAATQKRPICALSVILFSWISPRIEFARRLFAQISSDTSANGKDVSDLLIFDTVQRVIRRLECL